MVSNSNNSVVPVPPEPTPGLGRPEVTGNGNDDALAVIVGLASCAALWFFLGIILGAPPLFTMIISIPVGILTMGAFLRKRSALKLAK